MVRLRWPQFVVRVEQQRPEFLVRFETGGLTREPKVKLEGRTLEVGSMTYEEVEGLLPPVHMYRRRAD